MTKGAKTMSERLERTLKAVYGRHTLRYICRCSIAESYMYCLNRILIFVGTKVIYRGAKCARQKHSIRTVFERNILNYIIPWIIEIHANIIIGAYKLIYTNIDMIYVPYLTICPFVSPCLYS